MAQEDAKRILVVDDEQPVCEAISEILKLDGHEVETANTLAQAIELSKENHFDLVFLDYALADITGDKVLSVLRRLNPRQKIVIISGQKPYPLVGQADFLIRKPCTAEIIRKAVVRFA